MGRTGRPRGQPDTIRGSRTLVSTLRPHFWGVGVRRALGVCTTSSRFLRSSHLTAHDYDRVTIWFDGSHAGLVLGVTVKLH